MYVRRAAAVGLVAALALSGCTSSGSSPRVLPTLASPSAVPSSTSAPVTAVPAAARVKTPQGASAFAKYWFEQLDLAYQGKASFPLAMISDKRCGTCSRYIQAISASTRDGRHQLEPTFTDLTAEAPPLINNDCSVLVSSAVPVRHIVDASGKVVETTRPSPRFVLELVTEWQVDRWVARAGNVVTVHG